MTFELSSAAPTAVQFPADAHETELSHASGESGAASTPADQIPSVSVKRRA
jgi:hypothetical protein